MMTILYIEIDLGTRRSYVIGLVILLFTVMKNMIVFNLNLSIVLLFGKRNPFVRL